MSSTNSIENVVTKPPETLTAGDAKACVNSWLCRGTENNSSSEASGNASSLRLV